MKVLGVQMNQSPATSVLILEISVDLDAVWGTREAWSASDQTQITAWVLNSMNSS